MLKARALSATLWSAVEQIGAKGLSTIFMLIFARYLTAEDFGVFAAATLAIGFASKLAVFGLNTVVVQRPDLDTRALSTGFWLALGASILLAALLVSFAPLVAALFDNAAVTALIPALAIGMVVASASTLMTALLRRELNMKALARRTLTANTISGVIATPFILSGFGAWGLVIQSVGGAILTLALTIMLIGWPFKFVFDVRVAREMWRFGAPVTGADLLTHYNRESPKLFVGLFFGAEALGIFAMAMRVMNLMLEVVGVTLTKVTLPVMSQVSRSTPDRMAEIYVRLLRLAALIIVPSFLLVLIFRGFVVDVLLGANWSAIIPILLPLLLAGLFTVFNYVTGSTLVAMGFPEWRLWIAVMRALAGTILFLVLGPLGLLAVGYAFLARSILIEPISFIVIAKKLKLSSPDVLFSLRHVALSAILLLLIGFLGVHLSYALSSNFILPISALAALIVYVVTVLYLDERLLREVKFFNRQAKNDGSETKRA